MPVYIRYQVEVEEKKKPLLVDDEKGLLTCCYRERLSHLCPGTNVPEAGFST
jgi:hypothetical protein